jgi:hypothetical protein
MIATPAPASETHLKEKMLAFATTTTSLFMCVVQEATRQKQQGRKTVGGKPVQ